MSLSEQSTTNIAGALAEDFNVFLYEFYDQQLSEVIADAAVLFVDTEFGAMDGDLAADLALKLVQTQYVGIEEA